MTVSMSAVWDRTSAFLGAHLGPLAGIAGLTIFVPGAIGESLSPLWERGGSIRTGLFVLGLALMLVSLWGQLAITALVLEPAAGAAAARARASRRFGAALLVTLALMLGLVVLALPVLATLLAAGVDLMRIDEPGAWQSLGVGAGAFVALYGLVLGVLLLLLVGRLALTTPVVVAEDRAVGAIGRAFRLSRGLTWRIVGVVLLYGIVLYVVSTAAKTVFGALFALLIRSPEPISAATVLTALVVTAVGAVFGVISTVFVAELYRAVRAREDAAPA